MSPDYTVINTTPLLQPYSRDIRFLCSLAVIWQPNAKHEPRPEAEAQRTLEGVACMPSFGQAWVSGSGSAPQPRRPPPPNTVEPLCRPSAVSSRSGAPAFACQQHPGALPDRIRGLLPQDRVAVVAHGVGNDGKRVSGQARHLGHHRRGRDEASGDDGRGPDASLFGQQGVVHTARRATASIPPAEMTASQPRLAASTGAGAGRLTSGGRRRITACPPYAERRLLSRWSSNGRTLLVPWSNRPIVRPASDVRRVVAPAFAAAVSTVGSSPRMRMSLVS
jgi:hypothetical protein